MWKIACSGAWCVLVCLVAVYAGFQWAPAPKQVETQSPGLTRPFAHHAQEIASKPRINAGQVAGCLNAQAE